MVGRVPRVACSVWPRSPKWPVGERFGVGKGTRIATIGDGTSNTVLLSEVLPFDQRDRRGEQQPPCGIRTATAAVSPYCPGPAGNLFLTFTAPNSATPDTMMYCDPAIPQSHPNKLYCVQNRNDGNQWAAARSRHSGGVNAAFADGSRAVRPRLDRHHELAVDGIQERR